MSFCPPPPSLPPSLSDSARFLLLPPCLYPGLSFLDVSPESSGTVGNHHPIANVHERMV